MYGHDGLGTALGCYNWEYFQNCWWSWGWRGCDRHCSGHWGWDTHYGPWRYSSIYHRGNSMYHAKRSPARATSGKSAKRDPPRSVESGQGRPRRNRRQDKHKKFPPLRRPARPTVSVSLSSSHLGTSTRTSPLRCICARHPRRPCPAPRRARAVKAPALPLIPESAPDCAQAIGFAPYLRFVGSSNLRGDPPRPWRRARPILRWAHPRASKALRVPSRAAAADVAEEFLRSAADVHRRSRRDEEER